MGEGWFRAFAKAGPWAMAFAALLTFYLSKIDPALESIRAQHDELRVEMTSQNAAVKDVMGQVLMAIERSNYLERRNCINTARTVADRDACAKDH